MLYFTLLEIFLPVVDVVSHVCTIIHERAAGYTHPHHEPRWNTLCPLCTESAFSEDRENGSKSDEAVSCEAENDDRTRE